MHGEDGASCSVTSEKDQTSSIEVNAVFKHNISAAYRLHPKEEIQQDAVLNAISVWARICTPFSDRKKVHILVEEWLPTGGA